MTLSLTKWISDADALRHLEYFRVPQAVVGLSHIRSRADDYYLSLVGDLFDRMRESNGNPTEWARLGNALAQFAADDHHELLRATGIDAREVTLFAAAAFYCGGFPASAYLTIRERGVPLDTEPYRACFDLLARPTTLTSITVAALLNSLRIGNLRGIATEEVLARDAASEAINLGPNEWVATRLLQQLITRFGIVNIRAVLPDGSSEFWSPLVNSFLNRAPATWEFFPSQVQAIRGGFLERPESYSLQMPTGAGKTTLCETLLFYHLQRNPSDAAVLLVPYRSLASELRNTLVRHLNAMGLSARCAYGGTVPTGDEVRGLDETRALIATPESLSGLLSADPAFFRRISLVICDEGHLLDGGARGVSLELLLARMRAREGRAPRFVFVSAIVPNIEEINAWLGGTPESVVRSDYRPALAEFSVLRARGSGASLVVDLEMHPHETQPTRFTVEGFLQRADFRWINQITHRPNTYPYTSVKTQAIGAARKAMVMGGAVVFAANKQGNQGAVGLAEELLNQLRQPLSLPRPMEFADTASVGAAVGYLDREYGANWVGSRALAAGAVLHHGDIPQETREVIEGLLRRGQARLAICTNTLAEGVNLPIRTLVLYSMQRRGMAGHSESLLARDIKNLVGRAGRAGATTKGLIICANEQQWPLLERVARQAPGEPVIGALHKLVDLLRVGLARENVSLTNEVLEETPELHSLVDGIDATLIDLAAEELGEEALVELALRLGDQTFASRQADIVSRNLLRTVFELRARRVVGIRSAGRLAWIRETGTRARLLDSVENGLAPRLQNWENLTAPLDQALVDVMFEWAWTHRDLQNYIREAYRLTGETTTDSARDSFYAIVTLWLLGRSFASIAANANLTVDELLGVHAKVLTFGLQTIVEQGIALVGKLRESQGETLSPEVTEFPDRLRFGVPTAAGCILASGGVRHRRAAVELGNTGDLQAVSPSQTAVFEVAQQLLLRDRTVWQERLGSLVFENTLHDVTA